MNLDGQLLRGRRDNKAWLDDPGLGRPVLCLPPKYMVSKY